LQAEQLQFKSDIRQIMREDRYRWSSVWKWFGL